MRRTFAAWTAIALLLLARSAPSQPLPQDTALRPVFDGLRARPIGPANMGGRIVDLAVVESSPDTFYIATAGGGVWKTTDGGATCNPVFDDQPTMCIGSVAVCQAKPEVVYVGSGEGNPRNSVSWGNGVYKSTDGGKTWKHCGLSNTHHIGRVVAHPTNPNVAYVAAMGHFWGPNKERGLYKTTDGGASWIVAKVIDADTGFIDLQMDPSDPETLYAAAWHPRRDGFSGGNPEVMTGKNGGLFKTTDGGLTWEKMTGGLPEGAYGRCGLSVSRKDPNVVYAIVQTDKTNSSTSGQMPPELTKGKQPAGAGGVEIGGLFRSEDKGKTWKKVNDIVPRPFYYGQVRVDPTDDQRVYVLGVGFYFSTDGGKTFAARGGGGGGGGGGVHPDHHALWINPKDPDHLILGNDGGLYVSKDKAKSFQAVRTLVIGQFYGVAVDMKTPYRVYGGLQDNGSWGGPSATAYPDGVTLQEWRQLNGGDGFQAAVDPTDPDTVYLESQYGALSRITLGGAKTNRKSARPTGQKGGGGAGGGGVRYNWNSPILLSPHDAKTLYYGGQFLYKTTDRGDTWTKISPDLTRGPKEGRVTNSGHTILATAESPVKAGVLWVGTDDGNLWVSKDDGKEWAEVTEKIPGLAKDRAIPKVECSFFEAGTAYVAIDRHRNDDFKPYIFKTTDYGQTWAPLVRGLPDGAVVGVVRQSSKAKELLFCGTELGLYVSLDEGKNWHHLNKTGLPACVRVDDLVIHPRERELVIGTHGRSIWVMDIAPLEQLSEKVLKADAHLFDVKPVLLLKEQKRGMEPPKGFAAKNPPPGPAVTYLVNRAGKEAVLNVVPVNGKDEVKGLVTVKGPATAGLHTVHLDLKPGEYTVTLLIDGKSRIGTQKVVVKAEPDPKVDEK